MLTDEEAVSPVIKMDWEDRTSFEAIETNFGLNEAQVIALMRRTLKLRSFNTWRARVSGRKTKYLALRSVEVSRGYSSRQYKVKRGMK
ncbi:MAG: TIGR03643 family protein [Gammaproteobacteria bacterium]|nr:TIGR03643 family protein [Gammaproteobacteria bacterium]